MQRITKGLAALLLLAGAIVGLPWLLITFAGNPLSRLTSDNLTAAFNDPTGGVQLVLTIITFVAWAAWLTFALSVLVELLAQLRGVRAPTLPALSLQQHGARILVSAVLGMTGIAGPAATVASAATPASTPVIAQQHAETHTPTSTAATPKQSANDQQVTVKQGDNLWSISERTTGAGKNWTHLYDASRTMAQPGGTHLSNPNQLQAGWKITVPAHLAKAGTNTHTKIAKPHAHASTPRTSSAPTHTAAPQQHASTPQQQPSRAQAPAPAATTPAPDQHSDQVTSEHDYIGITATGLSALTAAGVIALLASRRRHQSRRRTPGTRIALPEAHSDAHQLEHDLLTDADTVDASDLDRAMRTLAKTCLTHHVAVPGLRAARILPTRLELYLVADADEVPSPFTRISHSIWTIARTDLLTDDDLVDVPAPYPCLVTLGLDDENAWVLLNLELIQALGIDAATTALSHDIARGIILELVTSAWADDLRVTLVDYLPELADALGSDRITHTSDLDHLLAGLEVAAHAHAEALASDDLDSAATARLTGDHPDTWTPQLLLLAHEPTPAQRERLSAILQLQPRLAVAVLSHTSTPLGEWVLNATSTDAATLAPIGLRLSPQHLDDAHYAALLNLFETTTSAPSAGPAFSESIQAEDTDLEQLPAPHAPAPLELVDHDDTPIDGELVDEVTVDETIDDAPEPTTTTQAPEHPGVEDVLDALDGPPIAPTPQPHDGPLVRLLGTVQIQGATGKRPQAPGRSTEIITYLALHPAAPTEALDEAIWPGKPVTATKRNGPVTAARTWLGTTPEGQPYLAHYTPETGYTLADETAVDWHTFLDHMGDTIAQTPTEKLTGALSLVDDQPLKVAGKTRGAWAWAEVDRQEIIAMIADIAHELATRSLRAGDPRTATWAAAKGIMVEPANEALWRDALRAAWQSAIPGRVETVAEQLTETLEEIAGELEYETLNLLADLQRRDEQRKAS
ncbi:LysM peptidoglycan-binding domain-containing protein [Dermacoccus sp. Tok2021]|uniref:LysM peptidoglycan-binding domain-containing protein n=1 Tax=Dermacoccus sp. Tok2021 TaxID=2826873 RepID=UPI001CA6B130|nr:LysM peptidoglycan-binding domain-containing protein [Dermacoccus sp. Tok2021]MBZ4497988.1 LysM peptidoglycan-binding domain-containing protein [Dermacoccus sp. Tok2021]